MTANENRYIASGWDRVIHPAGFTRYTFRDRSLLDRRESDPPR